MNHIGNKNMTDIFVFGSNLAGRHGAGSALEAYNYHGATIGFGVGRAGNSYAIPTKDCNLKTLDLHIIQLYVNQFLEYANNHPTDTFNVVAIGCGLAGYKPSQIAPMFRHSPKNDILPKEFKN